MHLSRFLMVPLDVKARKLPIDPWEKIGSIAVFIELRRDEIRYGKRVVTRREQLPDLALNIGAAFCYPGRGNSQVKVQLRIQPSRTCLRLQGSHRSGR